MSARRLWLVLPRQLRALPADLAAVVVGVVLTNAVVFVPVLNETPLRVVVGLAFVLFIPGYAFIAALFPEAGTAPAVADESTSATEASATNNANDEEAPATGLRDRGIDGIERVALSFGLSIAIVPLIGLALNFTPFGIRLIPIVVSISMFTLGATALAAVRRWALPVEERFRVPYREWVTAGKTELFNPTSTVDAVLNVVLIVSILLALSSVVYAVAVPPQGEQFTEFYILTEDDDGELVAADYPDQLKANTSTPLHVGIENNEYEQREYSVVVQLQAVETEGNETRVLRRSEVDRWTTTLAHNRSAIEKRAISIDSSTAAEYNGTERRLVFLLYDETPPAQPTRENAYRTLHLWVEVEAAG